MAFITFRPRMFCSSLVVVCQEGEQLFLFSVSFSPHSSSSSALEKPWLCMVRGPVGMECDQDGICDPGHVFPLFLPSWQDHR